MLGTNSDRSRAWNPTQQKGGLMFKPSPCPESRNRYKLKEPREHSLPGLDNSPFQYGESASVRGG